MERCTKFSKLEKIQEYLINAITFLNSYLPLANAHAADFIVKEHWDTLLSEQIRAELGRLSEQELISLPVLYSEYKSDTETFRTNDVPLDSVISSSEETVCPGFLDNDRITVTLSEKQELTVSETGIHQSYNSTHTDLKSFIQDSRKFSLPNTNFVLSRDDFRQQYSLTRKTVTPGNFMKQKKHHEIDVMSDLCSALADRHSIDVICDLGSGKGYLGTQLSFQHKIPVLGIDAASINTAGAVKRTKMLAKQWKGLLHNAKQQRNSDSQDNTDVKEWEQFGYSQELDQGQDVLNQLTYSTRTTSEMVKPFSENEMDCNTTITTSSDRICNTPDCSPQVNFRNICHANEPMNCSAEHVSNNDVLPQCNIPKPETSVFVAAESKSSVTSCILKSDKFGSKTCKKTVKSGTSKPSVSLYVPVTVYLNCDTDLSGIVKEALPHVYSDASRQQRLMLTGLHTCGALGSNILRLFLENPSVGVLSYVACCYQLMEEEFCTSPYSDNGEAPEKPSFPMSTVLRRQKVRLGRTARNLASQSIHRIITDNVLQGKRFYPRALLQVILHDMGFATDSFKGLRKLEQKSSDTVHYVRLAFKKLGLPEDKVSAEVVQNYCEKYKDKEDELMRFFQLRACLAPCIESIVLLDRVCYLLEQENIRDVELVQLFDPVISPRCYGIIAVK